MTLEELLLRAAREFERNRVPFFLLGGLAVSTWVEPRATADVDLAVCVRRRESARLRTALIGAGARPTNLEMRKLFEKRFQRFRVGAHSLDVRVASSEHDRAAWARSRPVEVGGREIRVASPEDLLLYKLAAWRPHDRVDAHVLLTQRGDLDRAYVERWLDPIAAETAAPMRERWRELLSTV